jgi:hypothetical protein
MAPPPFFNIYSCDGGLTPCIFRVWQRSVMKRENRSIMIIESFK